MLGYFISKKVYNTNATAIEPIVKAADYLKAEKRKDLYMQNALTFVVNFYLLLKVRKQVAKNE
jgi:hypothetical protein